MTNRSAAVHLRRFVATDLESAHRLSAAVGWPHRLEDWCFALDTGTGYVAEVDGAVVGTAFCWKFGQGGATIGMIIVSPDLQGQGIGRRLFSRVVREVDARLTFLYATPAARPLYESLGFRVCGELVQYRGPVNTEKMASLIHADCLWSLREADMPCLIKLASDSTGLDRKDLLPELVRTAEECVVIDRGGTAVGFALLRRSGQGISVGPVVATAATGAEEVDSLVSYCLARYPGVVMRIDVPVGAGIEERIRDAGLKAVTRVVHMTRNAHLRDEAVARDTGASLYAVASQALG